MTKVRSLVRCVVVASALFIVVDGHRATGQQAPAHASLSGIVLTTEDPSRPVRRAIVSLRGGDLPLGRHAITDDGGRFEIRDVPAGRYDLSAKRPAFVTIAHGASRPEWPGTPLVIAAGQHLSDVTVRLAPGAVITGTIRDETGAPAVGLEVRIERTTTTGGLSEQYARTDSRGVYRFYGLPPGSYAVRVHPLRTSAAVVYARRDAEVDAILRQLQQDRSAAQSATLPQPAPPESPVPDFAPIYYPGVATSEDASPVAVAAGEERGGVDIVVRIMRAARIAGQVVGVDGGPVTSGGVSLARASRHPTRAQGAGLRADGTFEFTSVAPGRYQLVTWRTSSIGAAGAAGAPCQFAAADVEVTGGDLSGLRLVLRPCLRIAGRVEVARDATTAATRADLAGMPVRVEADRSSGAPMDTLLPIAGTVAADGTFTIGGSHQLVPGPYVVHAGVAGRKPGTGWWLQSARTSDGRDILDAPLTLTTGSPDVTDVVLTFTDRHTSLSGSIVTAGGRPAVDYTIIAFTTNRDWWRAPFRRVLTARPATDGAFLIHDLPPGEYLLAALAQVAPNEWLDPSFLAQIASQAVPVTIGPGEQKVQSLQIRGG
jgi:hypothetical protein